MTPYVIYYDDQQVKSIYSQFYYCMFHFHYFSCGRRRTYKKVYKYERAGKKE